MKKNILSLILLATIALVFSNCKKEEEDLSGTGSISFELENRAGNSELELGKNYVTHRGDTVNFTKFDYFISNFVLIKDDGSEYTVPKDASYFLCKHDQPATRTITLDNIPAGNYKAVRFIIGVDSLKSVSDISERTGVLDPSAGASGMYWAWNSGYIFVKVEGTSPQAPLNASTGQRTIQYHTGLFGGKDTKTLNNLKTVTLTSTDEVAKVRRDHKGPEFHLYVDLLEMFTNPTDINVFNNPTSHAGAFSKTIADNYADMFTLDHVHNHE
jgi:hypothetical protein